MPFQGRGNVQITKYGCRVRVRVRCKDVYGPYRRSFDSAQWDLIKLLEKVRSPAEKELWLQELKCTIGVHRGGRDRIYCRDNEYAESSEGVAEKMEIPLRDCGEQEEVPFYEMSSCTADEVDREA